MFRSIVPVAAIALLAVPASAQVAVPRPPATAAFADIPAAALAPVAIAPGQVIQLAIVERNRTAVAERRAPSLAATPGLRFEIGSLTKVFTALLLAEMAARGEVRLDTPLRDLLPAGTLTEPVGARLITLRDLASHHSGLPRLPTNLIPVDFGDPYGGYDEAMLLAFVRGWKPVRAPGAGFEYSNLGAGLLGAVLARTAGKPFETLLAERILSPLKMRDTGFDDLRLAIPYAGATPVKPWHLASLAGAGGLRSTTADMARFAAALASPPARLAPAVRLLLAEPVRPTTIGGGTTIGLGLFRTETKAGPIYLHDGGTGGMRSFLALDLARGRSVIVLTNQSGGANLAPLALETLAGAARPGG